MLNSSVGGLHLACCVYNASGPRTYSVEALTKIAESRSGAVLAKSSINSEGLPNSGVDYYISTETVSAVTAFGKPYIVSLSGFTLSDNLEMLKNVLNAKGIDAIELNLACPNIPGKSITAYDFDMMEKTLQQVSSLPQFASIPVGIKLPPYFDVGHVQHAATILAKYPVRFVVCCNSIPNGLFIDVQNECEAIAANNGLGGLSGGFIKHTALANVRMMHKALRDCGREDIDIVGAGGVATGRDAFELILCGASAVQVGTCHWTEGARCFERIAGELETLMKHKGYKHIEDFRGKLKAYVKPTHGAKPCETVDAGEVDRAGGAKHIISRERGSAGHVFLLSVMSLIIVVLVVALSYTSSHGYFNKNR
eukprot:gene24117-30425_t